MFKAEYQILDFNRKREINFSESIYLHGDKIYEARIFKLEHKTSSDYLSVNDCPSVHDIAIFQFISKETPLLEPGKIFCTRQGCNPLGICKVIELLPDDFFGRHT